MSGCIVVGQIGIDADRTWKPCATLGLKWGCGSIIIAGVIIIIAQPWPPSLSEMNKMFYFIKWEDIYGQQMKEISILRGFSLIFLSIYFTFFLRLGGQCKQLSYLKWSSLSWFSSVFWQSEKRTHYLQAWSAGLDTDRSWAPRADSNHESGPE